MFGDNLSFISDTTIAACNGQGCEMKDKFRENFWIAFPAAVITLVLILVLSFQTEIQGRVVQDYHLIQIFPYILVLIGGIIGINVFVVLLIGIVSGAFIMLIGGHITPVELLTNIGSGVSGMFETCMVAILVASHVCAIREHGGFEALLSGIQRVFKGKKKADFLVWDFWLELWISQQPIIRWPLLWPTPLQRKMALEYKITSRKTASILDTFFLYFPGVIPYGAQMLVAISAAKELGFELSAFQIMRNCLPHASAGEFSDRVFGIKGRG